MSARRIIALGGKELRDLGWFSIGFAILATLVVGVGVAVRGYSPLRPVTALVDLLAVTAIHGLLAAERQGADLSTATARHLFSFPLQPLEVVVAKAAAFLVSQTLVLILGGVAFTASIWLCTPTAMSPGAVAHAACRIALFSVVCWSVELAVSSWPRVGLAVALASAALYLVALAAVPIVRQTFNVFHLVFFWADGIPLLGPATAAGIVAWLALLTTAFGLLTRTVEE